MIVYMSLEERVDADFTRARRRAFFRRLIARLRNVPAPDRLPRFGNLRKKLGAGGRESRRTEGGAGGADSG